MTTPPVIDVKRASDRPHTKIGWLDSKHSFSFGRHYDPKNTGHGLLLVNNDDIVRGGSGFDTGGLVPIASGKGHDAAISIRQRGAVLWGARLTSGETVAVPDDRHVHVFVPRGSGALEGAGTLSTGDAVRLTGAGSPTLTAGAEGAEVLIWATA